MLNLTAQLLISTLVLLNLSQMWKANGHPVVEEFIEIEVEESNPPEATTFSPIQLRNDDEKIQLCADRLREMIMYICRHYTPTPHHQYYDPHMPLPSARDQSEHRHSGSQTTHRSADSESFEGLENEVIRRRSRRQVVQECCSKPCYKRDLLKYCDTRPFPNSPETSTLSKPGNTSHNRQRRRQKWKLPNQHSVEINQNSIPEPDTENLVKNNSDSTPKPLPCRCPNKHRRKANRKSGLPPPPAYLPYQMLFIPYGNTISPLGPANAVDVGGRTAGAFLQLNLNEPKNFVQPGTWNLGRSHLIPTAKAQRHTFENPLFQQRSAAIWDSDEGDLDFENNELGAHYRRIQHQPLRSLIRIVTDSPNSQEDPIPFSRGTNDNV